MRARLLVILAILCLAFGRIAPLCAEARDLRLSLLYDNTAAHAELTADWGFSCLVQCDGRTILFDTGAKPEILLHNMRVMGVDKSPIEAIVFSHEHPDHVVGVSALGGRVIPLIYLPRLARIYDMTSAAMRAAAVEIVSVSDTLEIAPSIRISRPLGGICHEQGLVIDTRRGLVVVVGCSHPGVIAMLDEILRSTGRPLYALIGGLHLGDSTPDRIDEVIAGLQALNVQQVCPCHCTGETAVERFRTAFQDRFVAGGAGTILHLVADTAE